MEWLDAEIKLFISTKGPFNLYTINHCLKSRPLTPLMSSSTLALAALNNLSMAKPPLPINALNTQPIETKVTTINYGRDLATLVKIYIKKSKYSREDNNFNRKLIIFNNLYNRVNIL